MKKIIITMLVGISILIGALTMQSEAAMKRIKQIKPIHRPIRVDKTIVVIRIASISQLKSLVMLI